MPLSKKQMKLPKALRDAILAKDKKPPAKPKMPPKPKVPKYKK